MHKSDDNELEDTSLQYYGMLSSPFAYSFSYTRTVNGMRGSITPNSPLALRIAKARQQNRLRQQRIRAEKETP